MDDDTIMRYKKEKKTTHDLHACFRHSAKLQPLGWLPTCEMPQWQLGCDICNKGLKKAVEYAEYGWAD